MVLSLGQHGRRSARFWPKIDYGIRYQIARQRPLPIMEEAFCMLVANGFANGAPG